MKDIEKILELSESELQVEKGKTESKKGETEGEEDKKDTEKKKKMKEKIRELNLCLRMKNLLNDGMKLTPRWKKIHEDWNNYEVESMKKKGGKSGKRKDLKKKKFKFIYHSG